MQGEWLKHGSFLHAGVAVIGQLFFHFSPLCLGCPVEVITLVTCSIDVQFLHSNSVHSLTNLDPWGVDLSRLLGGTICLWLVRWSSINKKVLIYLDIVGYMGMLQNCSRAWDRSSILLYFCHIAPYSLHHNWLPELIWFELTLVLDELHLM